MLPQQLEGSRGELRGISTCRSILVRMITEGRARHGRDSRLGNAEGLPEGFQPWLDGADPEARTTWPLARRNVSGWIHPRTFLCPDGAPGS